jgi:hypothetical protein
METVYIIEGLLRNESDIQPDTIHADTQDQSLPVSGLASLLGFELLPRIRNWHDLIFYRPDTRTRYQHSARRQRTYRPRRGCRARRPPRKSPQSWKSCPSSGSHWRCPLRGAKIRTNHTA